MVVRLLVLLALTLCSLDTALAITPDDPGPSDVLFTIDSGQNVKAISPWIYGSNSTNITNRTFDRLGGNRWSAYNWETNDSNAGKDYKYQNDNHLSSSNIPGAAVRPTLQAAAANNRGFVATVPMAGYVSADDDGPVDLADFAPSARFHEMAAKKSIIYPGSSLSLTPNTSDNYVFSDEFVNWIEQSKSASQEVFYSLDNEPGLWGETLPPGFNVDNWDNHLGNQPGRTHPEIHPYAPTFAEMRDKTIAYASAIKDVNPNALVFGGVGYGWNEFTSMQDASDTNLHQSPSHPGGDQSGEMHYNEYLLDEVRKADQQRFTPAELAEGKTLMDVLDLHWYPEARGVDNDGESRRIVFDPNSLDAGVVAARLQAPRSLWDPTYTETSWVSQWGTWVGSPGNSGPIRLLPRVQRDIDDFKPGTKIAITEYSYGGGNHISGAVAQADALGVFGREGVFAASWWELSGGSNFVNGAFDIYRNYDGAGGTFGDTSVDADTNNIANSAVYASVDSDDPSRMILVAINRTNQPLDAGMAVTSDFRFDFAEVFQLTSASSNPVQVGDISIDQVNAFHYTMPAYSVSTLVLHAATLAGDFDADGDVDGRDFLLWQRNPAVGNLADWQANYGMGPLTAANVAVPEPGAIIYLLGLGGLFFHRRISVSLI